GIRDRGVTSMAELLGRDIDLDDVKYRIASHLAKIYDMTL
ncbi:MAG: lipoyl(octanoyl) transferase, partial [Deltaproteobacteria bacterium]|nr:lipoyl(octanoyl) transferase [Deltaproteobacteria bacterium]